MADRSRQTRRDTSPQPPHSKRQSISSLAPRDLRDKVSSYRSETIAQIFGALDKTYDDDAELARIEEDLIACAERWQHLELLDAAARGACAILEMEGDTSRRALLRAVHQGEAERVLALPLHAAMLTKAILSDPLLMLDHSGVFELHEELDLEALSLAMVALFVVEHGAHLQLAALDQDKAATILRASELRADTWATRIARLTQEYEQETYPNAALGGTSTP